MKAATKARVRADILRELTGALFGDDPVSAGQLANRIQTDAEYVRVVRRELEAEGLVATRTCRPPEWYEGSPHPRTWISLVVTDRPREIRWTPADLDRCEHGRHSIDHCFDCPGGQSVGNRFLMEPPEPRVHSDWSMTVRIGSTVHGAPIHAVVRDAPREA